MSKNGLERPPFPKKALDYVRRTVEAGVASSEERLKEEIRVLKLSRLHSKHQPLILAAEELLHGRLLIRVRNQVECGRAASADRLRKDVKVAREAGLAELHGKLLDDADKLLQAETLREKMARRQLWLAAKAHRLSFATRR